MSEENPLPSLPDLIEKRDRLIELGNAIDKRLAGLNDYEKREVEALSKRAINPQCSFDRKYREMLYTLALFPDHVSWYWRLRERLHRFIHHH